jgi:hypothetical protein
MEFFGIKSKASSFPFQKSFAFLEEKVKLFGTEEKEKEEKKIPSVRL